MITDEMRKRVRVLSDEETYSIVSDDSVLDDYIEQAANDDGSYDIDSAARLIVATKMNTTGVIKVGSVDTPDLRNHYAYLLSTMTVNQFVRSEDIR